MALSATRTDHCYTRLARSTVPGHVAFCSRLCVECYKDQSIYKAKSSCEEPALALSKGIDIPPIQRPPLQLQAIYHGPLSHPPIPKQCTFQSLLILTSSRKAGNPAFLVNSATPTPSFMVFSGSFCVYKHTRNTIMHDKTILDSQFGF